MRRSTMTFLGLALVAGLALAPVANAAGCSSRACGLADATRHGKTTTVVAGTKAQVRTETRIKKVTRVKHVTKINNVTRTRHVDVITRRIDTTYVQPIKRVTIIRQIQPVLQKRTITRYETMRVVRHVDTAPTRARIASTGLACRIKPAGDMATCARLK